MNYIRIKLYLVTFETHLSQVLGEVPHVTLQERSGQSQLPTPTSARRSCLYYYYYYYYYPPRSLPRSSRARGWGS